MLVLKRKRLSSLEKKCLMKFYLHDSKLFQECSNDYVKSLGFEMTYETILQLAEENPIFIKVMAKDEDNFIILFDENSNGDFQLLFVMRNGLEFSEDDDGENC